MNMIMYTSNRQLREFMGPTILHKPEDTNTSIRAQSTFGEYDDSRVPNLKSTKSVEFQKFKSNFVEICADKGIEAAAEINVSNCKEGFRRCFLSFSLP